MKQFKNILLVAPFDKQELAHAVGLMRSAQSNLTLMSVVPELETPSVVTREGKEVDLQSLLETDVANDLQETANELKAENFRTRTVVSSGNHAFLNVIRQVQQHGHDMVMMVADGVSGVRNQLFGNLSMHLMRECPCAVWILKPTRRTQVRNVFAALDPAADDPQDDHFNTEILRRAIAVAHSHNAKLHIIHAWSHLNGEVERISKWMTKQEIRLHVEKVAQTHRTRLSSLLKLHGDGSETVHLVQGNPETIIPQTISDQNCDLLVMGTVCRNGIPGIYIGDTAQSVLNQVDCSVLTIKPKDYVSPIHEDKTAYFSHPENEMATVF